MSSVNKTEEELEEDKSDENSVKSKAIVKFSTVQVPGNFSRLQCNTDLNMPPSNWLSNSINSYGMQHAILNSTGFSSFRMAHKFPDCVGGVDVVSDAENIKRLLKLPYSLKSAISMMVHRIGNTLLIDEFDIHKYLLRKSDEDWEWLRRFVCDKIISSLTEKERNALIKNRSRNTLQEKSLISKFLYHSLPQETEKNSNLRDSTEGHDQQNNYPRLQLQEPLLPEPDIEENIPDPSSSHTFNRNVVWTFEDIRMLIGTDMPIFGSATRPCISLRLRDMSKPINVLTGIDYWLDNLMCNVPEVVMCYHLDGIVQKYELIKTEDLPFLENSKFSPKIIRNVAQNILAFLKANATKAGHTYWLFKGPKDDVVKLYDLTTLCSNNDNMDKDGNGKSQNPFTIPVAMLLYTVARNMKTATTKMSPKQAGSIKMLLDNCIKLLPKEKYPQIVISSHYLLSDLNVPAGTDPISPNFVLNDDYDIQSVYEDENDDNNDNDEDINDNYFFDGNLIQNNSVTIKNIQETIIDSKPQENWKHNSNPPSLTVDVEKRCQEALQHIVAGLHCLQYFASKEEETTEEEKRKRIIDEEQNLNMARPFQPIPLPYESLMPQPKTADPNTLIPMGWKDEQVLSPVIKAVTSNSKSIKKSKKKSKKGQAAKQKHKNNDFLTGKSQFFEKTPMVVKSWNVHLKLLLLEKACLTYATLTEQYYSKEDFGTALRYIYIALCCQQAVVHHLSSLSSQKSCLLGRAGDCYFQFVKNFSQFKEYLEAFNFRSHIDTVILEQLQNDIQEETTDEIQSPVENMEELMVFSCKCYESALKLDRGDSKNELLRRLGNVQNELGVKYMYRAQEEYNKYLLEITTENIVTNNPNIESLYFVLLKKSYNMLENGIKIFEKVNDPINLSYVLCNMGRYMRLKAYVSLQEECTNNMILQKKYYSEAFACYQRALGLLESRQRNTESWDVVNWELSTATFTLAKQLQDATEPIELSDRELYQEVADLLQKAIKFCDVDSDNPNKHKYLYRSGLIHQRLASYYHKASKYNDQDDKKRRSLAQISKLHYEKSIKIFENILAITEYFEVQTERINILENQTEVAQNYSQKIKLLSNAMEIFRQSLDVLGKIINSSNTDYLSSVNETLALFEKHLQNVLRSQIKLALTKSSTVACSRDLTTEQSIALYKSLYNVTLRPPATLNINDLAKHLCHVIRQIDELYAKNETEKKEKKDSLN